MIYLTYADPPSGVFSSQVNDVCNYLNKNLNAGIRLVAFISLRDFKKNKAKIKKEVPRAIVLPMLPKANYWKFSVSMLMFICLFLREKVVIARGVLACNVALGVKKTGGIKKLCYDGRGAIAAEWEEYKVAPYKNLINTIESLEKNAALKTDFRISVSNKLVEYWKERFGYSGSNHVMIPCTLNSDFKALLPSVESIKKLREDSGFTADDLILVYSGSTAGWQSFGILQNFLSPFLKENKCNKILFMSGEDDNIKKMINEFPGQVKCKWVDHKDVQKILSMCDYGILIREKSITNKVASPTKFAEYLSAGLKVLISEDIGDYTDFVKENNCGHVVKEGVVIKTERISREEKQRMIELVAKYFTKSSQNENYKKLINEIRNKI
jgi:glycosyltransferase involved in cell wall biosynthesis